MSLSLAGLGSFGLKKRRVQRLLISSGAGKPSFDGTRSLADRLPVALVRRGLPRIMGSENKAILYG
jgi:hypothetical protein